MKGIHINPPACAMEEIRLNIQNVEKRRSDQVRTIKSGMLWPKHFSLKICLIIVSIIFGQLHILFVIITLMINC
jgi:hypothetical protein